MSDDDLSPQQRQRAEAFRGGANSDSSLPDTLVELWAALAVIGGPLVLIMSAAMWSQQSLRPRFADDVREMSLVSAALSGFLLALMLAAIWVRSGRRWMILWIGAPIFGVVFLANAGIAAGLQLRPAVVERALAERTKSGGFSETFAYWCSYLDRYSGATGSEGVAERLVDSVGEYTADQEVPALLAIVRKDPQRHAPLLQRLIAAADADTKRAEAIRKVLAREGFSAEAVPR